MDIIWDKLSCATNKSSRYTKNNFIGIFFLTEYEWSTINVFIFSLCAECKYGYEYDQTWFESTIITEYDWVCEARGLQKTNAFVYDRIGEVVGTFVFGQMGDK